MPALQEDQDLKVLEGLNFQGKYQQDETVESDSLSETSGVDFIQKTRLDKDRR